MSDVASSAARRIACGVLVAGILSTGCANQVLKVEHAKDILRNDEFDRQIKIEALPTTPTTSAAKSAPLAPSGTYVKLPGPAPIPEGWPLKARRRWQHMFEREKRLARAAAKKKKHDQAVAAQAETALAHPAPSATPEPTPIEHPPPLEDSEGFIGRRPKIDPFRVGEKVSLDVSYFGVSAGDVTIEVRPFVEVNGRKSYNFVGTAISTSVFAVFYAVDDWFETFVDFDTMTPSSYALHVKETKQLRETRSVFDWTKNQATWWDKKISSDQKVEENKKQWDIPPYAQNVFSLGYYLRAFQLRPGKKLAFHVSHENENLTLTAEVLRRERITTPAGEFDTVVVKPKIELNGVFKPVGDIFIWFTDDDRKFITRVESKIKIGTIVGVIKKLDKGQP